MSGSTILIVLLVVIAAAVLGGWAYRRAQMPTGAANADGGGKKPPEQWGVRIEAAHKDRACPQVRALLGQEFPLATKPPLPLPDCLISHQCECRYVRLFDRRGESRRLGQERRQGGTRFEQDKIPRRAGKDRRGKKVDWY